MGRRGESAFVTGLAAAPALFFTLLGGVVAYTLKARATGLSERERERERERARACN
jgi:hypothetical protein